MSTVARDQVREAPTVRKTGINDVVKNTENGDSDTRSDASSIIPELFDQGGILDATSFQPRLCDERGIGTLRRR